MLYGEDGERHKYRNRFGQVREYSDGFEGVIPRMERLYHDTESEYSRADIERYMVTKPCPVCEGKRLKPEALAVTIGDKNIMDVCAMPVITDAGLGAGAQRWQQTDPHPSASR